MDTEHEDTSSKRILISSVLNAYREDKCTKIQIKAFDAAHAQAQAIDICRALDIEHYALYYGECKETPLSQLFQDIALNNFTHNCCEEWCGKSTNKSPCIYLHGRRLYVRQIILKYLDIPLEGSCVRCSCGNKSCINPYHFEYGRGKNEKITSADRALVVAWRMQGASIPSVAKAFGVHVSTIYRKLKDEHLHSGA